MTTEADVFPTECTLPTTQRPLRQAGFAELLGHGVVKVELVSKEVLRLELPPEPDVAARAARLAVQETSCCAFFEFGIDIQQGSVVFTVRAPGHPEVLTAMTALDTGSRRNSETGPPLSAP